jgi:Mlc titration factor MtfA (ptsG expression regulator)
MAAAVVLVVPVAVYGLTRHRSATCLAFAAAFAAAGALYWAGTRIIRRRIRALRRPFPPEWERILTERVAFFAALGPQDKERFRQLVTVFLAETPIRGAGCEIDDATRMLVAASAVIPIFALPDWEYGMFQEVLVRQEEFTLHYPRPMGDPDVLAGMVGGTGGPFNGTLVLSKPDLERGFAEPGEVYHVGIHEFAHLIDKGDGGIDGVPASLPRECFRPWLRLVRREMERAGHGPSDIPRYAFTNEQEFFAVAAEYFFQAPDELAANHPELYDMLRRVFRQDPRARLGRLVRNMTRRPRRDGRAGRGSVSGRDAPWE